MHPKLNIYWSTGNNDFEREEYCISQVLAEALRATMDHQIIILLCHISLKPKIEKLVSPIFHYCLQQNHSTHGSSSSSSSSSSSTTTNGTPHIHNRHPLNPDKVHVKYVSGLYAVSPTVDHGPSSDKSTLVTGCHVAASIQYLDHPAKTTSGPSPSSVSAIPRVWFGYIGIDIPSIIPSLSTNTFNLSYFQRFLTLLTYIPPNTDSLVTTITLSFRYLNPLVTTLPSVHRSINNNPLVSKDSSTGTNATTHEVSPVSYQSLLQLLHRYYE